MHARPFKDEGLLEEGAMLSFIIDISEPRLDRAWVADNVLLVYLIVGRLQHVDELMHVLKRHRVTYDEEQRWVGLGFYIVG